MIMDSTERLMSLGDLSEMLGISNQGLPSRRLRRLLGPLLPASSFTRPATTAAAVCIRCREPLSFDDGTHAHPSCGAMQ